jgi:DNA polymerase
LAVESESLFGIPKDYWSEASPAVDAESVGASVGESQAISSEADLRSLEELELQALSCQSCRLSQTRNKVVFGVGSRNPRIVFVGEGPGAEEDLSGEPFVGKAGAFLTAAITKGMNLRREDVYICNVVKCRPPENRNPLPDEVSACENFLFRQLELLSPEVIITLGSPAQKALTGIDKGITRLRGNWLEWRGVRVMPTFHPAYILRNVDAKRPFWEDLQEVMKVLGISTRGAQA